MDFLKLSPEERHRQLMRQYFSAEHRPGLKNNGAEPTGKLTTDDAEALRQGHRFIRGDEADDSSDWASRLARKYYDRLYREYCFVDLSLYKYGCIGMRWRTEKEVVDGKGQFVCGAQDCPIHQSLSTYEVNFVYMESGERKQTLVKVRLCASCAEKMNHKRNKTALGIKKLTDKLVDKKRKRKDGRDEKKSKRQKKEKESKRKKKKGQSGMDTEEFSDLCLEDMFV